VAKAERETTGINLLTYSLFLPSCLQLYLPNPARGQKTVGQSTERPLSLFPQQGGEGKNMNLTRGKRVDKWRINCKANYRIFSVTGHLSVLFHSSFDLTVGK
jgi:hypothetical protein